MFPMQTTKILLNTTPKTRENPIHRRRPPRTFAHGSPRQTPVMNMPYSCLLEAITQPT